MWAGFELFVAWDSEAHRRHVLFEVRNSAYSSKGLKISMTHCSPISRAKSHSHLDERPFRLLKRFDKKEFSPHHRFIYAEIFMNMIDTAAQNTLPIILAFAEIIVNE